MRPARFPYGISGLLRYSGGRYRFVRRVMYWHFVDWVRVIVFTVVFIIGR